MAIYIKYFDHVNTISKRKKWGFCTTYPDAGIVIACDYDNVCLFSKGVAAVCINEKWGLINEAGNKVLELLYDNVKDCKEGMSSVVINGKWGFVDHEGRLVIPLIYDAVRHFSEGLASVKLNGKAGFIDKWGELIVELKYDDVDVFENSFASVEKNEKYGIIDKSGKEIVSCISDVSIIFSEGLAVVSIVDELDPLNPYAEKFANVVAINPLESDWNTIRQSSKNHRYGLINKVGVLEIPLIYDVAFHFKEGLAAVSTAGKWGFIDKKNNFVIPTIYEEAYDFNNGNARVRKNGKWGYISKDGNAITPFIYELAEDFSEGFAICKNDSGVYYLIDTNGHETVWYDEDGDEKIPVEYEHKCFSEGLIGACYSGDIGFMNKKGKWITERKFITAEPFRNGLALVKIRLSDSDFAYGYIDKKGNEYWED